MRRQTNKFPPQAVGALLMRRGCQMQAKLSVLQGPLPLGILRCYSR